jgi:uncharacterized membrane protein
MPAYLNLGTLAGLIDGAVVLGPFVVTFVVVLRLARRGFFGTASR